MRMSFEWRFFFLLLQIVFSSIALAQVNPGWADQKPSAEEIAKEAFGRSFMGIQQGKAELKMVITSANGEKKDRTLSFKSKRGADGLLQYLVRFEKPADVRGTSFLVRERKGLLPDQYIYLPAAKVVRRVAAGNAASSFFGSDFIYADLLPYPSEKKDEVSLKRLADAKTGGQECYVLEILPKNPESPYGKLVVSVQKKEMIPVQIDFFDRQKKASKTMKVRKLKKVEGKLIPGELEMKNLQSGSKTELYVEKVDSKVNLNENEFTEEAMQR